MLVNSNLYGSSAIMKLPVVVEKMQSQ